MKILNKMYSDAFNRFGIGITPERKPAKRGVAGDKLAKKVAKGHLTMKNPGGIVAEYFRNARQQGALK